MSGVRRSGRIRNKGPVICENTVETAIGVDLEDSDNDDFQNNTVIINNSENVNKEVKQKKRKKHDKDGEENEIVRKPKHKKGETSKGECSKTYTFQTRSSPKKLFNAIQTLTPVQKMCLERIGLGGILDFKLDGIPNKIAFYVVDNFNPETMEIKILNDAIVITKELIGELLGISNDGTDIMEEEVEKDLEMVERWNEQFDKKEILTGDVKAVIRKSKVADMNFKLNFIVLFANVMGGVKGKAVCDLSVLDHIRHDTDLASINWCEYVWRGLKSCKDGWKKEMTNSYFLGPLTLLTMAYVDGVMCDKFDVPRVRPPTKFWTFELLKEREKVECDGKGLGMGGKQGPYVEEDVDPMPTDEEGFVWKLSKLVEVIRSARTGFEKTLESGLGMFPGNMLISDLNQQYREALMFQKPGDASGSGTNKEGRNASNEDPFESPELFMGPQTQMEVFRSADDACEKFYADKTQRDMEGPSFSIGLSQDPLFATQQDEHEVDASTEKGKAVVGSNIIVEKGNGSGEAINVVKAVPLTVVKPGVSRRKRLVTKSSMVVSPFVNRRVEIDTGFTNEEKQMDIYLINKNRGDLSEVMFDSQVGASTTLQQIYTLVNDENIDDHVITAWSAYLNSLEKYKSQNSFSRFYLPTFVVDKKKFSHDKTTNESVQAFLMYSDTWAARLGKTSMLNDVDVDKKKFSHDKTTNESVQAFLMYSETWAARLGKTSMLNDVDVAYIPISNGVHKFVLFLHLKYPDVIVFDNNRVRNKNGSAKQVLSLFPDIRIAEVVRQNFAAYMRAMNHVNAEAIDKAELRRPEFLWETDNRPNDCGIFAMRHMETYMGTPIVYWKSGFVAEGKKQVTQLGKLRRKYVTRLLLAECNTQKDRIQTELAEMQEKNVGMKKRKGPPARK
ncbi:hypothetical protein CTI12_AA482120 [Artemisia annua]|uniref:Ubiquitin-like protease family profile domain-containing protein n=1 Tax=Artemisia annua TaxID=35608 RepID=A0A2U1LKE1_ARTAN|nr:hypothetical protein CTI12_AA482120 [Artemisia annua]